ncbi:pyridoxamine 5'-phosphate oxidase family protein [Profundibacterium mesophilum]|uniref:General stress protein FMN-binding split barrel domain-containing protein n=1 Tax=Profundibacterium mesophilum KAUST100406-0324 TaxID=1037889 RepID=A0A921NSN8_9RHOB|nr:pyridoxamine 5'-phosphate oxidase family protein [Profundibacterium mesophilum]KAF0677207.1 hypothetical protein PMES_00524 [Profundibacterium mesophilum KAUST100406-0324]
MSQPEELRTDPRKRIFKELDDVRAGMLGIEGSEQLSQPMTHHAFPEEGVLRFITSRQTDLAEAIGSGRTARYVVISKNHDFWMTLRGEMTVSNDREKIDEIWSRVSAAWFDEGREDPEVTMLELRLTDGSAWAATGNPLVFGWEILRANMDEEHKPEIGEQAEIRF